MNQTLSDKRSREGNEMKSDKKAIEISPDSIDLADETKSHQKEIEVKPKDFVCNFNECEASFTSKQGLKRHIDTKHLNLKPHKCTDCPSAFTKKALLQYHMNEVHLKQG